MRLVLTLIVTAGLTFAGCGESGGADPLVRDLSDLCSAAAERLEVPEQESAFFDRAHDAVHELARRVTESDPGLGAELLEAKQAIESELTETFGEPIPTQTFARLIAAANDALAEIDLEEVSC